MISSIGSTNTSNITYQNLFQNSSNIEDIIENSNFQGIIDEYIPSLEGKYPDYSLNYDKLNKGFINSFDSYVVERNRVAYTAMITPDLTVQNPDIDYQSEYKAFLEYQGYTDEEISQMISETTNQVGEGHDILTNNTQYTPLFHVVSEITLRNPTAFNMGEVFQSLLNHVAELNSNPELSLTGSPEEVAENFQKMLNNIKNPDENISKLISVMDKYREQLEQESIERTRIEMQGGIYHIDYSRYTEPNS